MKDIKLGKLKMNKLMSTKKELLDMITITSAPGVEELSEKKQQELKENILKALGRIGSDEVKEVSNWGTPEEAA